MPLTYEGNPKHKEPWQRGRKGSLCPSDISREKAQELLFKGVAHGNKRYGALGGKAYCAHQHDAVRDRWHGHPVGWVEVPASITERFLQEKTITPREVRRHWESTA